MRQRILLANAGMKYNGGTQAWIRQMHGTLSGSHEVHVFSADGHTGGLPRFDPALRYDVALVNHWPAAQALRSVRIGTRVHTSHGVIPHEEIPVLGADHYVSVSEAVQARVPYRSTVIRNPIDMDHFAPDGRISRGPRRVAFVSNRQGDALPLVREACQILGADLEVVGKEAAVADPLEVYRGADLVVGIARVAMEALAVGKNVLCFDYQGFHGMATEERLPALHRSNFGGHEAGTWPTAAEVAGTIRDEFDPGRSLRDLIREHHDPSRVAVAYMELAERGPSRVASVVRRGPRQLMSPKVTQLARAVRQSG